MLQKEMLSVFNAHVNQTAYFLHKSLRKSEQLIGNEFLTAGF